jgi:restriction system protein
MKVALMDSFTLSDSTFSPLANRIPYSAFVDREEELYLLTQELIQLKTRVALIFGSGGIGKTRLAVEFARQHVDSFSGGVYNVRPMPMPSLSATALERITNLDRDSLLIIDDAEQLPDPVIEDELAHILSARPKTQIILTSRRRIQAWSLRIFPISLAPFTQDAARELIGQIAGTDLTQTTREQLYARLQGNPFLLAVAATALHDGLYTAPELLKSLEPFRREGLLGPDGRPLGPESKSFKHIVNDIRGVSDELLKKLAKDPKLLYELSPRLFEQVVAELLERMGYEVTLTPASRDGGKDVYAASRNALGSFLYIVECKKYAPDNLVGVSLVRQLYGVVQAEKATAGILATTSFFTKDAKEFQGQVAFQISLQDYLGIQKWLQSAERWNAKPQKI